MFPRLARLSITNVLLASSLIVALPACGGGGGSQGPLRANVQAGDLPEGAEWDGVYYSPLFGYLHLVKDGNAANARWRTTSGEVWGELAGTVTGDMLRYEWEDHKIGMVGPSAKRKGKGYFKYTRPKADEADELHGEFGVGEDEVGTKWVAVKQKDMKPNLASIAPDETEKHGVGGGWDDAPKPAPEGKPEEKEAPAE